MPTKPLPAIQATPIQSSTTTKECPKVLYLRDGLTAILKIQILMLPRCVLSLSIWIPNQILEK